MNWNSLFDTLQEFIPLFAGLTGHPELGALAQRLIHIGENELQRRMQQTGKTRTEILQEAAAAYVQLRTENEALKRMGHENR
jgi:hypothetical protein